MLTFLKKQMSPLYLIITFLLLASVVSPTVAEENRQAARAYQEEIASIEADPEWLIDLIMSDWGPVIEQNGGSPSQLETTLRAKQAETLLEVSGATSIEEINEILSRN